MDCPGGIEWPGGIGLGEVESGCAGFGAGEVLGCPEAGLAVLVRGDLADAPSAARFHSPAIPVSRTKRWSVVVARPRAGG